jgi:hypothetical protein
MSGGSSDDATLAIAHLEERGSQKIAVLDLLEKQAGEAPFNPRDAVTKFVGILSKYGLTRVAGDRYAGETFRRDFSGHRIYYEPSTRTKSEIYEAVEPAFNGSEIELLDHPKLQSQLLGLTLRGTRVDHVPNEHDDFSNSACGALALALESEYVGRVSVGHWHQYASDFDRNENIEWIEDKRIRVNFVETQAAKEARWRQDEMHSQRR